MGETPRVPSVDQGLRESRGVCDGRKILKSTPKGLEELSKAAYSDVSFYLRASHLQKLRNILEDSEASDNDRFVAYTMLLNQCVAAEGELPTCQDTGTAICIDHKGETSIRAPTTPSISRAASTRPTKAQPALFAGGSLHDDRREEFGHEPSGADRHLRRPPRHGVRVPLHHQGRRFGQQDLPLPADQGAAQRKTLTEFIRTHIRIWALRPARPYHLAICIGGTSAKMCLSTVKKASAGYLDALPVGQRGRPLLPRSGMGGEGTQNLPGERRGRSVRQQIPRACA